MDSGTIGDVMHAYDPVRPRGNMTWADSAWDNTELGLQPVWLWVSVPCAPLAALVRMATA